MFRLAKLFSICCIILVFAIIGAVYANESKTIVFLIPETATKVMAEGISKFREEYPSLAKKVNIVVYPGRDLEQKLIEPDFSDADIIFLNHISYRVMLDMEKDLKIARARGAKVIGIGGYDVFRVKGYYNVDVTTYPEIAAYWEYNGPENVKRLIAVSYTHLTLPTKRIV